MRPKQNTSPVREGAPVALDLVVERTGVLHFLGYPDRQSPPDRMEGLLDEAIRVARSLVYARGVFVRIPAARAADLDLEPVDATGLVLGMVTIGDAIETRVSELLRIGAATRSLFLDAAGNAAVEEAANRLGEMITENGEAPAKSAARKSRSARHVSCRISPGYGRWPVTAQRALFDVVPHRAIGVSLLPTMLMTPRKTISFAMWLGAGARRIAGLSGCTLCELERCRYRRADERAGD